MPIRHHARSPPTEMLHAAPDLNGPSYAHIPSS